MKFFRLDLLTLLISLFILNSCKRQDGIGLGINPTNSLSGNFVVDTNIVINTVPEDTTVTSGLTKTPLAYFDDPQIGNTKSNIALALGLPDNAPYTVPVGTLSIDSVVMVLKYADGFYGDSLASRFRINVYQIAANDQVLTKTYYSNRHWQGTGTPLGSKTFTVQTHDSVTVTNIRVGKVDTIKKLSPHIRIPFDKTFIYNNLFNASGTQLSSNDIFQKNVRGLYVTISKDQPSDVGGIIQLNIDSSRIDVFYKSKHAALTDTAMVSLPFPAHVADVTHTYLPSVQSVINNQSKSNGVFYLQGLGGLRAKVSFPDIKKFAGDSILLNRAELVITPKPGTVLPYAAPLQKLTMYQLDIAKQRTYLQDVSGNDPRSLAGFGGHYSRNTTTNEMGYHFLITSYLQDLIRKKTVDYGTYIGAVDTTAVSSTGTDIAPTIQTGARTILIGSDKSSPYNIKLNIIYTRIK